MLPAVVEVVAQCHGCVARQHAQAAVFDALEDAVPGAGSFVRAERLVGGGALDDFAFGVVERSVSGVGDEVGLLGFAAAVLGAFLGAETGVDFGDAGADLLGCCGL